MNEQELEIIQGVISAVVYQNYDNGYAVLRLGVGGGQAVTVVGTIPLPAVGERLISGNAIGGRTLLDPQGVTTRAQFATIMMRYILNVVQPAPEP